jgi:hypothetical protein
MLAENVHIKVLLITFHLNPLSNKKTTTYEVVNPGSNLGQAKNVAGLLSKSKK